MYSTINIRRCSLFIALCALFICAALSRLAAGQATLTESSSARAQPGRVTIYRDDWGVPHIYAATEEDGFYALGYAQAEDHLEGVLRKILTARGQQAAAFGAAFIETDFAQQQWMHMEEARAGFARLSPQLQKNYRHFILGLQRYIEEHPAEVPAWAPKLEAADLIAWTRALLWTTFFAGDGLADCRRGGVKLSAQAEQMVESKAQWASNEWVLAPWRTADQALMVLSDPHGDIDGSFVYEFRMEAGALKIAGFSIGAIPLLTHNRTVSWGMTTGAPDVADCYEIAVDPANPRRYRYDGEWQTMTTREVTIEVKGGKPMTRTFEYTRHSGVLSPVVARQGDKAYVVSTPYMPRAGDLDEEVYRMNLARNVKEVREAMKSLGMFAQNVMVGDANGNSYYVRAGRTPKRPAGYDWRRPVPGNSSQSAWQGIHPLEDLVQIENPPQGYMQNNNIAPDTMMEKSPLTADRYPPYIFNDEPGRTNTRGLRAVEVLSQAFHFTVPEAIELSLDEKWVGTEAWQQVLRQALNQNVELVRDKPPQFRRFVDRLLQFDGFARAESVAALNYLYWRHALWSVPEFLQAGAEMVNEPRGEKAAPGPVLAKALLEGVDRAIAAQLAGYGTLDLKLGEVMRIGRDGYSWPLGGTGIVPRNVEVCAQPIRWDRNCVATLRAMNFGAPDERGQRWAVSGSRLLRLVIFTNPIQSFTLHNYGQSGRPDSRHYMDQARLSSERRLKPTYFEKSELLRHAVSNRTLEVRVR